MRSLVSVVMPAYNGEKYIADAIESIINQSYTEWELIIVDDASIDNTLDVIKKYKDDRISLYINDKNRGISYSTNLAISKSNGKYIALLDDDDIATKDRLLLQAEYLDNHPSIDILGGRAVNIDEYGNVLMHDSSAPLNNPKLIRAWMNFANRRFSNGTTMIRKEFIEKNNLRFKEGYYGIQDFKFMADSSKVGNISSIDRILQFKRIHSMEATNTFLSKNYRERREMYANLQRESIIDSGYVLTDEQIRIITECIPEEPSSALNDENVLKLIEVFAIMYEQAECMRVDYIEELKIVFKRIIIDYYLRKKDYFEIIEIVRNGIANEGRIK